MSLKHIVLGLLSTPHSGYDLKKEFEYSLKNFWRAELSQIYPLLQKLEEEGLIAGREAASEIGPRKRVYKSTAKGKRELRAWLTEGPTVGTERVGYLAQVYFLADLDNDDEAVRFMQELKDYMSGWLAKLEAIESEWGANDPRYPDELPDGEFYPQLTLALGLKKVRATVEWCDESIRRIKARRRRLEKTA